MSRAVLLSIGPFWCAKIANGEKTLELRKRAPKLELPFKCYIYCTKTGRPLVYGDVFRGNWETEYTQTYGWSREDADRIWGIMNGKIIGEFVCDYIVRHCEMANADIAEQRSLVGRELILEYANGGEVVGIHISKLKMYEEPVSLEDIGLARAPQSWQYIEEFEVIGDYFSVDV